MSHKTTKREQAVINNLSKFENDEHKYLAVVQRAHEGQPKDENINNALNSQINRWSVAYRLLHETLDIIEA